MFVLLIMLPVDVKNDISWNKQYKLEIGGSLPPIFIGCWYLYII